MHLLVIMILRNERFKYVEKFIYSCRKGKNKNKKNKRRDVSAARNQYFTRRGDLGRRLVIIHSQRVMEGSFILTCYRAKQIMRCTLIFAFPLNVAVTAICGIYPLAYKNRGVGGLVAGYYVTVALPLIYPVPR